MGWQRTLATLCTGLGLSMGLGAGAEEPPAGAGTDAVEAMPLAPAGDESTALAAESAAVASPMAEESGMAGESPPVSDAEPLAEVVAPAPPAGGPALGEIGYDAEGRPGRIHVVVGGDTLWDISNAYLGTPWVWPSIWQDNGQVANPHVIHPGDRIWITPSEMRRISAEEADALLAGAPAAPAEDFAPMPAAMDPLPAPIAPAEARTVRVAGRESTGLISRELYQSSASVVDKVTPRLLMSQEDQVYIGLGESEVSPGDEFTLFRTVEVVEDPDTGELLGYHVDILGWLRVETTHPETSLASIRMSTDPIEVGDRVMPREPLPPEVAVQASPAGVEGKISFFPQQRVLMGFGDFVYLNRGTLDGLEVGSPLEVFRAGSKADEVARDDVVAVPDRVIASMLVVRAEEESAVAVVTATESELELGDRFRGAGATQ